MQVRAETAAASLQRWLHAFHSSMKPTQWGLHFGTWSLHTHTRTLYPIGPHRRPVKYFKMPNSWEIVDVWGTLMHELRPIVNNIAQHESPACPTGFYFGGVRGERWHLSVCALTHSSWFAEIRGRRNDFTPTFPPICGTSPNHNAKYSSDPPGHSEACAYYPIIAINILPRSSYRSCFNTAPPPPLQSALEL